MKVSESRTRPYGDPTTEDAELSEWIVRNFRQVAESPEQDVAKRTLISSIEKLIRSRGWRRVFVGSNTFFAWKEGDSTRRVGPDVYLLDDPPEPPEQFPLTWCTWLPGHRPPRFAVEVVAKRWTKDYVLDPVKYEELGCKELVIFDPHATPRATYPRQRVPLTVFRRTDEGRLETVYSGKGPARSEQLDLWLFPIPSTYLPTLRLSEDEAGTRIVPTTNESDEATGRERDQLQTELEAEQATRLEKEAALVAEQAARRAETEAHEREVGALKTQLREAQAKATTKRPPRGSKPKPGGK